MNRVLLRDGKFARYAFDGIISSEIGLRTMADAPDALKKPAGVGLEPFGPGARCMIPQCDLQRANANNGGPSLEHETGSSGR